MKRFTGLPYLSTDLGFFVEVAVTVEGVTLSQIPPVLDATHRPNEAPNSFDVNTAIQRCLVKAIALHGSACTFPLGRTSPRPTKLTKGPGQKMPGSSPSSSRRRLRRPQPP